MHEMHFVDCGRVESEPRFALRLAKIDLHGSPYPETKAPSCGWSCRRWRRRSHVGPGHQARGLEVKDVAAGRSEGGIEAEGGESGLALPESSTELPGSDGHPASLGLCGFLE